MKERKMSGVKFWSSYPVKLGLTFACLLLVATGASSFLLYTEMKPLLLSQMGSRLEDLGRAGSHLFGPAEFDAIDKVNAAILEGQKEIGVIVPPALPGEYRSTLPTPVAARIIKMPEFQRLHEILKKIKAASRTDGMPIGAGEPPASGQPGAPTLAYVSLFKASPTTPGSNVAQWISDSDYNDPKVPAPPGNLLFNNSEALTQAFQGRAAADPAFRHEQGMDILTAAIPLLDETGKRRAILSLYYDAHSTVNDVNRLYYLCWLIVGGAIVASILCSTLLTWFLTRDIRTLRDTAARVRDRDFAVAIDLKRKDELGLLARTFNDMVHEIKRYAMGLEETNTAYARFVPKQILEFLGQQSITSIQLGDQVQRQMTVLFADIRSFTTISESMSPRDNFDFINDYLRAIGPVIRKHHGFIDKYIGDAIMALFPERSSDAVAAAIDMQKKLEEFNHAGKESGRPPIRIGIGIHRGNLMLGTVGEEERMEGTVISDAVNLTSRLQGLTKQFGAGIIVSEAVVEATRADIRFERRYLGETKVKGKRRTTRIYEVLEGADVDVIRRKSVVIKDFERALKSFERGDYMKARRGFAGVLRMNREDAGARYYFMKCKRAMNGKAGETENVITVDEERFQKKG